jgi:outer membrane protein assembly factor BamB
LWRVIFPCKTDSHEMPIVPSGPGATPTIAGGHVFALSREGDLLCIEATAGQLAWKKNLVTDLGGKRPVYGFSQSPLIADGRLFLDVGSEKDVTGSTIALDAATGDVKWRAGTGEAGYSSARILERDGRKLVAMFKGEALDIFDPADGRVLATHRTTARDFTNAATPAFVGHRVLVSNTGTDLAALLEWDATGDARPAWTHKQFALLFNSAIAHDGALFGYNEKRRGHHEFTCLDAATGETRWVSDAVPTSTFLLADGHWIFLTRDGELALAPATAAELKCAAKFKALEGKCYATPALANGRIFTRSNAGELIAFDARP